MNPLSEDRQFDHTHIKYTMVPDNEWIKQFETPTEDSPNTYITKQMVSILQDSLLPKRYLIEYVKADNLWRLQRQLRKGSWASRCLEWDGMYRAKSNGPMRIIRVKRLNLPGDETCKT